MFPYLTNEKRTWDTKGLIAVWIIHMVVSEPFYYAIHRLFHDQPTLFKSYHSLHHLSPVLHPFTGMYGDHMNYKNSYILITFIILVYKNNFFCRNTL